MVLCLGEPPRRFLLYLHFVVDVLHFIFDLHFIVICRFSSFTFCFSTSSLTLPWTIARFLHPFYTFSPAHCRVIHNTSIFNFSDIFLRRALRFWVGILHLQVFFTLRSFTDISKVEPAVLPWSLQGFILMILETQTRPIYLFDSQQSTILIFRTIRI